uniref:CSON004436 protein n=1 Tax=Culicoides sonorensis TaxID=179676 RepID=A0A336LY47_CULSO
MSRVPLRFRDWWDDYDSFFEPSLRTSRLLDQHFGTGLRRNDLLSSVATRPSVIGTSYIRPWTNTNLQKQDSGSTINKGDDKFEVILDVAQFEPSDITVKTTDKFIIVEGKHEEKQDEHGFVSRQFTRKYLLPAGYNPDDVYSSLSSDGVLTVTAPKKALPPPNQERAVPIKQTGAPAKTEESSSPNIEVASTN